MRVQLFCSGECALVVGLQTIGASCGTSVTTFTNRDCRDEAPVFLRRKKIADSNLFIGRTQPASKHVFSRPRRIVTNFPYLSGIVTQPPGSSSIL